MVRSAQAMEFTDEFRNCSSCGYPDGFHSMLQRREDGIRWLVIWPSCLVVFDLGYRVEGRGP